MALNKKKLAEEMGVELPSDPPRDKFAWTEGDMPRVVEAPRLDVEAREMRRIELEELNGDKPARPDDAHEARFRERYREWLATLPKGRVVDVVED